MLLLFIDFCWGRLYHYILLLGTIESLWSLNFVSVCKAWINETVVEENLIILGQRMEEWIACLDMRMWTIEIAFCGHRF